MKKKLSFKKWLLLPFLLINLMMPFLMSATVSGQDISFTIPERNIVAEIHPNGNVSFVDHQTYDVDYMNGALFSLDYSGYDVVDYEVGIVNEAGEVEYLTEATTEASGTYEIEDRANENLRFKVYYPANDETVEFVYEYELEALVMNYSDTADLNRRFGTNDYTTDVTVKIILPGLVENPDDFRAWGYGAPQGEVSLIEEDGRSVVYATVPNQTPSQFVEVQTIFPLTMTPDNPNVIDEPMREEIINNSEAQVQIDREQYQSDRQRTIVVVGIALLFPPLVALYATWYYFNQKRKLNPNPVKLPKHIYELPEDITPALMATAYFRTTATADDFAATVVDLARKGYLQLEEVPKEKRGLLSFGGDKTTVRVTRRSDTPRAADLLRHEQEALEFILPAGESTITLEELEQKTKKSSSFQKSQYNHWETFLSNTHVRGRQISKGVHSTRSKSQVFAIISLMAPVVVTLLLVFLGTGSVIQWNVLGDSVNLLIGYVAAMLVTIIWAIVLLILTFNRPIRTAEEDYNRQMWQGFANMLEDIGNFNMREIASLPLWEAFLVYAISLGVADKVTKAMEMEFSAAELDSLGMGHGYYGNPYLMTSLVRSSVASSVSAATPSSSSSGYSGSNTGGFGGGFSGGSSGGSGGGTSSGGF